MIYVLLAAVAAGAVVGSVRSLSAPTPAAVPEPVQEAREASATRAAPAPDEPSATPTSAMEGEVLEVIEVAKYSYLRLGSKGSEGTWVAVPSAKVAVGTHVKVRDAVKMTDFKSTTLHRTFPAIYFGTLEGGPQPHGTSPDDPHASAADPHAGFAPGAADADPHAHASESDVTVKPIDRAAGPDGKTVAEVIAGRAKLAGKTVRIHATVVKSTPGVLGKTWLHLRDGSGAEGANDLTVTTDATPAVGDTVLVEGVVALDRDVGSGYRFPTLVEHAKLVTP
jgi:hypothetical protein